MEKKQIVERPAEILSGAPFALTQDDFIKRIGDTAVCQKNSLA